MPGTRIVLESVRGIKRKSCIGVELETLRKVKNTDDLIGKYIFSQNVY